MPQFSVSDSYRKHCAIFQDFRLYNPKSCAAVVKDMARECPDLLSKAMELTEATKFQVRRYGSGQFYCFPLHKELVDCSPWPASRYPKASLCVTWAIQIEKGQVRGPAGRISSC